jgi:hypothetical protein
MSYPLPMGCRVVEDIRGVLFLCSEWCGRSAFLLELFTMSIGAASNGPTSRLRSLRKRNGFALERFSFNRLLFLIGLGIYHAEDRAKLLGIASLLRLKHRLHGPPVSQSCDVFYGFPHLFHVEAVGYGEVSPQGVLLSEGPQHLPQGLLG